MCVLLNVNIGQPATIRTTITHNSSIINNNSIDNTYIIGVITLLIYGASWYFAQNNLKADRLKSNNITIGLYYIIKFISLLFSCVTYVLHVLLNYLPFRRRPVYMYDFSCTQCPDSWQVSTQRFEITARQHFKLSEDAIQFCMKLLNRSGLGEQTYFPPGILNYPPDLSMSAARSEAEFIIFNALDSLFASTDLRPRDIDILVVNCSLFNPTPSLAAMIVNKYQMREDIQSYNLSGMGCSAGLISIKLANDLLQRHRNATAVVVSTEIITQAIYLGEQKSMLLQNSLFRCGGAAIALTNKPQAYAFGYAKYQLMHAVRSTLCRDDESYQCVFQQEDEARLKGVRLGKELMAVAARGLKRNITRLGPKILPYTEQAKFIIYYVARFLDIQFRICPLLEKWGLLEPLPDTTPANVHLNNAYVHVDDNGNIIPKKYKSRIPDYIPNFKTCIDYLCIHAGGRAVIDAIQTALNLSDDDVEPSRWSLQRYGNTSSSSIWYELRHIQDTRDIKKGQMIWQLGFGSGFKCNSAVWKKL